MLLKEEMLLHHWGFLCLHFFKSYEQKKPWNHSSLALAGSHDENQRDHHLKLQSSLPRVTSAFSVNIEIQSVIETLKQTRKETAAKHTDNNQERLHRDDVAYGEVMKPPGGV